MGDDRRAIFSRVKRATVALAFIRKTPGPRNRPFDILGSGFCVDPSGVVITCRHVIEAFMTKSAAEQIADAGGATTPVKQLVRGTPPQVIFFAQERGSELLHAAIIQAWLIDAKTDRDLAAIRIGPHDLPRTRLRRRDVHQPANKGGHRPRDVSRITGRGRVGSNARRIAGYDRAFLPGDRQLRPPADG